MAQPSTMRANENIDQIHREVYSLLEKFLHSYHAWLYISDKHNPILNATQAKDLMLAHRQRWLDAEAVYVEFLSRLAAKKPKQSKQPKESRGARQPA